MDAISERLRKARLMAELSQTEASKAVDVHSNTLAAYESGKTDIPLRKALELCAVYGITISFLVGEVAQTQDLIDLQEIAARLKTLEAMIARRSGTEDQ